MPQLKPYQKYKPSGIQWLGDVPQHWEVCRLKDCVSQFISGGTPSTDNPSYWSDDSSGTPWVAIGDMTRSYHVQDTVKRITPSGLNSKKLTIIPTGTLLYSMYASLGKVALLQIDAVVNQAILGIVADRRRAQLDFLRYWLEFMQLHVVMLSSSSTQDNLNAEKVRGMTVFLPPLPEQRAIADYLDHQTNLMDSLVAKKKRMIELLAERRQSLITHAVTKGLDPQAPMRQSGIQWIGDIPEHWEVRAVWTLFELGRGRVISHEDIISNPGQYPVYSSQTESDGVMGCIDTYDFQGEYLTWTTDGARAGAVFLRQGKFNCTNVCGTLRASQPDTTSMVFFKNAIGATTKWFVRHDINPKLMNDVMARIKVQAPPYQEQRAIADYLDHQTAIMDALTEKLNRQIELLAERRQSLITHAVTGKIDVTESKL